MSGGRCGFGSVSILFLSMVVACGGDREAGAPAGDAGQTPGVAGSAAAGARDTARGSTRDTAAAEVAARSDTMASAGQPDTVAQPARPKEPAAPGKTVSRKPAAPKKPPATMETPDTHTAAAPAETAQPAPAAAAAAASLRDEYHRAPLDTVTQQVYDGWKQFNLNCARCHGEDVQGTIIAPHLIVSLKPDGSIPTKELFVQIVCAGRPEKGMPAWCPLGLEMDKIQAIYFYVKGRSEGKLHLGRPALRQ